MQDGSRHSETLKLRNDCPLARFDGTPRGCYDRDAGWSSLVARWAHNPKVGGSNPPPATKTLQQLARIEGIPYRPTSTLTSTFRSGFPFPVCHLRADEVNGRQRWSHRFMLERNARRCEGNGRGVPRASGTHHAPAPPLPAAVGTGRVGDGGRVDAGKRARSRQ